MKKKAEVAVALALLGAASALCLALMMKAGEWLDEDQRKLDEAEETGTAPEGETVQEEATEEDFAD